ncbi:hypothetical protein WG66_012891 [Moniliophthora roreri]|nr:hypothetical protein WG66_012891 [Moniliophthora roreri]
MLACVAAPSQTEAGSLNSFWDYSLVHRQLGQDDRTTTTSKSINVVVITKTIDLTTTVSCDTLESNRGTVTPPIQSSSHTTTVPSSSIVGVSRTISTIVTAPESPLRSATTSAGTSPILNTYPPPHLSDTHSSAITSVGTPTILNTRPSPHPSDTRSSATTSTSSRPEDRKLLSSGAIVGIVLAAFVVLIGIVMGILILYRLKRQNNLHKKILHSASIISPFPPETPFTGEKRRYFRDDENLALEPARTVERHNPPSGTRRMTPRNTRRARAERPRREGRFVYHIDGGRRLLERSIRQSINGTSTNVPPAYQTL